MRSMRGQEIDIRLAQHPRGRGAAPHTGCPTWRCRGVAKESLRASDHRIVTWRSLVTRIAGPANMDLATGVTR